VTLRRLARPTAALTAALTAGALLAAGTAAPSSAASSLKHWTGHVTKDADGDTEFIDIAGDGKAARKVRNAGIQAMEHGQCHAGSAAARMKALTVGKNATLSAPAGVPNSLGRPVRTVTVGSDDVQETLLQEGYVLFLNLTGERTNGYEYRYAMEKAATQGKNLWDKSWCKSGPQQSITPQIWINYDANGKDSNLKGSNAEYARIYNPTSHTLNLNHWWLRDATLDPYVHFKSNAKIAPHKTMFVWVRKGKNTKSNYHFGRSHEIFTNPTSQTGDIGDGVYLFDPDGDLRAHADYPCVYSCSKPALRITKVVADAAGDDNKNANGESITVKNTGGSNVQMWRVVLQFGGNIYRYGFGNVLKPGHSIVVKMGKGKNTAATKHFGSKTSRLSNSGGKAWLRTTEAVQLTCTTWGNGHC
jgi:endonuclease YncB( thermonuclease family)